MVSVLNSGSSGLGSSPGRGNCSPRAGSPHGHTRESYEERIWSESGANLRAKRFGGEESGAAGFFFLGSLG